MRWRVIGLALALAAVALLPSAGADHTQRSPLRCDGGFCSDGEHHVLECSDGTCTGDARAFPTIVEPSYDDGAWLNEEDLVLATTIGEVPRAYPIRVMNYFETVEETLGGEPVIVTYCPLCASGIVFSRELENRTLTLYNSGEIWNNDLVMYDLDTRSRWSQVGGEAIRGPLHGRTLELLPARIVEWGAWKDEHPDTRVLARPVDEEGNALAPYDRDPYASYRYSEDTPQGHSAHGTGLHPKTRVVGVADGDDALAFPVPVMRDIGVHQAQVGDLSVVAGYAGKGVHVYDAGDRAFRPGPTNGTMVDDAGTVWRIASGTREDGRHLDPVPSQSLFWFAWLTFHPETEVLNETGEQDAPPEGSSRGVPLPGVAVLVATAGLVAMVSRRRR